MRVFNYIRHHITIWTFTSKSNRKEEKTSNTNQYNKHTTYKQVQSKQNQQQPRRLRVTFFPNIFNTFTMNDSYYFLAALFHFVYLKIVERKQSVLSRKLIANAYAKRSATNNNRKSLNVLLLGWMRFYFIAFFVRLRNVLTLAHTYSNTM